MYCKALGSTIDPERVCFASGFGPACAGCRRAEDLRKMGQKKERVIPPSKSNEERGLKGKPVEVKKRRKCRKCGRLFGRNSNRHQYCPACQKENEILKNRERQARFQRRLKNGLRLTV